MQEELQVGDLIQLNVIGFSSWWTRGVGVVEVLCGRPSFLEPFARVRICVPRPRLNPFCQWVAQRHLRKVSDEVLAVAMLAEAGAYGKA